MSIEAPLSKYRKHNWFITMGICFAMAIIFGYDGYLSQYPWSMRHGFYQKHVVENGGIPDKDMMFNRITPPFFAAAGIAAAIYYLCFLRSQIVIVDDEGLKYNKIQVRYDQIDSIDKTHFNSKGFFIVYYTDGQQKKQLRLNDRGFDNMPAVLDHLVAKITS